MKSNTIILDKINLLKSTINTARDLYYNQDNPSITDDEYDKLFKELKDLEDSNPELITKDSPTQIVGGKASNAFSKVKHLIPMLSLDNVFNEKELLDFYKRIGNNVSNKENMRFDFCCEMKIDGLSIALRYKDGKLYQALTRGDGNTGEDVTNNVRMISSIPLTIDYKEDLEVRGEVIITKNNFVNLNKAREANGEYQFANPRNAAAGTLRQLDPYKVKERNLSAFIYYIVNPQILNIHTQSDCLLWLKNHNFPIQEAWKKTTTIDGPIKFIKEWESIRNNLNYNTDGVVIKYDDINYWNEIGTTSHAPRYATAYKYPPEEATTVLTDVELSVGRTGVITPVAIFNEVNISGTKVSRASLHNYEEVIRKDIKIGDKIIVRKAAEIIPEVVKSLTNERTGKEIDITIPSKCPICGANVIKIDNEVAYRCSNTISCPAQLKESIKYFASRKCMNIDGLGDKLSENLVDLGIVKDISDLYTLTIEQLESIDRMGKKSAENLINAINESKNRDLSRLIASLQIKGIATSTAELLAERFKSMDNLFNASIEDLIALEGIGDKTANFIYEFTHNDNNIKLIEKLKKLNINMISNISTDDITTVNNTNNSLKNKKFIFTGGLTSMSREEASNKVKARGGTVTNSINKSIDYVVVGDKAGSKLKKANELNLNIITEKEFISLL